MADEQEGAFDNFLEGIDDKKATVDAPKRKERKPFKLFSGGNKSKEKKKKQSDDASFYTETLDFAESDDDDFYGVSKGESDNTEREDTKLSLQTIFEFRWWELAVLVVELLLVVYLVLVMTKVIPLF